MEHLAAALFTRVLFKKRPQGGLRLVCFECRDFRFEVIPDINRRGWRRERDRLTVRQGEFRAGIIKFLRAVRNEPAFKLIGIAVGAAGPMKSKGNEHSGHRVIGMAGDSTFRAESQ